LIFWKPLESQTISLYPKGEEYKRLSSRDCHVTPFLAMTIHRSFSLDGRR
jgi:hypothetical protein